MKPLISIVVPVPPKDKMGERKLEIVPSIKAQKDNCRIILESGGSASENRNRGSRKAKTDFVAFANMHTILSKDWSRKVLEFFDKYPEIDMVGGPQLTSKNESHFARASSYALGSIFATANTAPRYVAKKLKLDANEKDLTSANLICRRKVLKKIKYDESVYPGEDPKFILDAKKVGFKAAYYPEIIVYQKRRESFGALFKQIFDYASARSGALRGTIAKNPLFLVPSVFIIYLLLLPSLFAVWRIFILPFALYVVLSIFFSLYHGLKNKDFQGLLLLPFTFFTIHMAYGLGVINGFFSKRNT